MSNPPTARPPAPPTDGGWVRYYQATEGRPPRPTLIFALDRFAAEGITGCAADLGCGDGRDTIEILRRGWSAIGIDPESVGIERLRTRTDLPKDAKLDVRCVRFEEADWGTVELVNSSFALPSCSPAAFPALWKKITASLRSVGRFAGQLYGPRDSWATRGQHGAPVTIYDEVAARGLFADYTIELFEEEETDSVTPRGEPKHWHIFHVVARRN